MKKKSFGILERFPTKCTKYFFPFSFSFSIENEKKRTPLFALPPFGPHFGGILVPLYSLLKIWDVMPPYLKTLFEQKTEI